MEITCGNIISDMSDHYSQLCIIISFKVKELPKKNCVSEIFPRHGRQYLLSVIRDQLGSGLDKLRSNVHAAFFLNSLTALTK